MHFKRKFTFYSFYLFLALRFSSVSRIFVRSYATVTRDSVFTCLNTVRTVYCVLCMVYLYRVAAKQRIVYYVWLLCGARISHIFIRLDKHTYTCTRIHTDYATLVALVLEFV